MWPVYVIHIAAGTASLISGYVALAVAKGAPLHRKVGIVFVWSMLTMCVAGGSIAAIGNVMPRLNVSAAVVTGYLVITSLTTVKPAFRGSRELQLALFLLIVGMSATDLTFWLSGVIDAPRGRGMQAFPYLMFGSVSLMAAVGDLRVLRFGAAKGAQRVARHLWRMTFALFVAAMSFFIGQAKVIPKPIRIPGLLALPVLLVLVLMFYWLWRISWRKSFRGLTLLPTPKVA